MKKEIKNQYQKTHLDAAMDKESGNPFMKNIWGWRFSMFGLVLLIIVGGFSAWLHFTGRVDFRTGEPFETETIIDSIETK